MLCPFINSKTAILKVTPWLLQKIWKIHRKWNRGWISHETLCKGIPMYIPPACHSHETRMLWLQHLMQIVSYSIHLHVNCCKSFQFLLLEYQLKLKCYFLNCSSLITFKFMNSLWLRLDSTEAYCNSCSKPNGIFFIYFIVSPSHELCRSCAKIYLIGLGWIILCPFKYSQVCALPVSIISGLWCIHFCVGTE